jgi:tetratricopeptide (TPR) repeat protein
VADNPRIEELQRRVHKDPASIAFAQLAEEYRRAGNYEEAVRVCRTGLAKHPSYLSARVTLGRALIELEQYEEAQTELDYVLKSAPENLAAIRGLAEIHQRRGELDQALKQYRMALGIAKHDPDIEQSVQDISRELGQSAVVDVPPPPLPMQKPAKAEPTLPGAGISESTAAPSLPRAAEGPGQAVSVARELVPDVPAIPSPDGPARPTLDLGSELEAAADDFAKALEALDSLTIELPTPPPLPEETLDLPLVGMEDDRRVVPAADWEVAGFDAAWAKRDEPVEPVRHAQGKPAPTAPQPPARRSSKSEGGEATFDPVITFTDQTIAPAPAVVPPVAAAAPPPPIAAAAPPEELKDEAVAELESFLDAILEDRQEQLRQ